MVEEIYRLRGVGRFGDEYCTMSRNKDRELAVEREAVLYVFEACTARVSNVVNVRQRCWGAQ
jgi:hypothetical protein